MTGKHREHGYHPALKSEDLALWEAIARTVKPLTGRRRLLSATAHEQREEVPVPAREDKPVSARHAAKRVVLKPHPHPIIPPGLPFAPPAPALLRAVPPLAATLEKPIRKKVIRGTKAIDGRIDLHGLRQDEAHRALSRFLHDAQAKGSTVVLVITGKGRKGMDSDFGVLRRAVPQWLVMPEFRRLVVSYEVAQLNHGGEGALYVHVRRLRDGGAA